MSARMALSSFAASTQHLKTAPEVTLSVTVQGMSFMGITESTLVASSSSCGTDNERGTLSIGRVESTHPDIAQENLPHNCCVNTLLRRKTLFVTKCLWPTGGIKAYFNIAPYHDRIVIQWQNVLA